MKEKQVFENRLEAELEKCMTEINALKASLDSPGIGEEIHLREKLNAATVRHAELEKQLLESRQADESTWKSPVADPAEPAASEETLRL